MVESQGFAPCLVRSEQTVLLITQTLHKGVRRRGGRSRPGALLPKGREKRASGCREVFSNSNSRLSARKVFGEGLEPSSAGTQPAVLSIVLSERDGILRQNRTDIRGFGGPTLFPLS